MTNIYKQFDQATQSVGAYAILKGNEYVGRVVFKYPRDGAGRLYCYVQVWGAPMQRGFASGGGYDKRTAAFENAVAKFSSDTAGHSKAWREAARGPDGVRWIARLERAGYTVACVSE